jgi:predicted O-methyltransferase YrrM
MSEQQWADVDDYLVGLFLPRESALEETLSRSSAQGLPPIAVAPNQGKMLEILARMQRARRILEIGTLGGYSTIWLARALPSDGVLVSLELESHHAEVARMNIDQAGLGSLVDILVGLATDSLRQLIDENAEPFDFIFIDADKEHNADYFAWALKLSRRGSLIVVDNVVRDGRIIDAGSTDPGVLGVRRLNDMIAAEPRVSATVIQTVGSKGYDGLAFALVVE